MILTEALAIIIAYVSGSIPFAMILMRAFKRTGIPAGANPGTGTIMRELNPVIGIGNLLLDMGKGALPVMIALWLGVPSLVAYLAGLAAVAGHCWSVFLRFKGGGGLATAMGVLAALAPLQFGIAFAIIVASLFATSNLRFSGAVGLVSLPLLLWASHAAADLIAYSLALPLLVLLRNIPTFVREARQPHEKKGGFIIDREHTPWQTPRRKRGG